MKKRPIVTVCILAILITGLILFITISLDRFYLLVENTVNNQEVLRLPVRPGSILIIQSVHSYEKDLQWDFYRIAANGGLALATTGFTFFSYDARNSTYPKGYSLSAGTAKITGIDQNYALIFPCLEMRIAYTVPQWLIIGSEIYQFQSFGKPGEKLRISVKPSFKRAHFEKDGGENKWMVRLGNHMRPGHVL